MLPYLLLLFSLALTARRLIGPAAYPLAFLALFFAGSTNGMFMPERIDHHGWQLALLALSIAAIADPKRVRGGLMLGLSTALSLAIGLEMIIYLALAGVAMVLFWVDDAEERERLARLCGVARRQRPRLCFLVFASNDNWNAVCDALSPVWLSDALLGSALMFALAWLSPRDWKRRLALAFAAGARHRGLPRPDLAAMPATAGRRVARGRAAVAEPRQGSAASLHARLARRDADHPRCRSPARSAGRCSIWRRRGDA